MEYAPCEHLECRFLNAGLMQVQNAGLIQGLNAGLMQGLGQG